MKDLREATMCCVMACLISSFSIKPLQAFAQHPDDNALSVLHDFLQDFYPELFKNGCFLDVHVVQPIDSSWRQVYELAFTVTSHDRGAENPPRGLSVENPISHNDPQLEGFVQLSLGNQIERLWVWNGKVVESEKNASLRKLVQSHPEWSEADAYKALRQSGARYDPGAKDELVKSVDLPKLEKFLGKCTVISADFNGFANPDHVGDFALLYWSVKVNAQQPGSPAKTYALLFEPFNGRLIGLKHLD